MLTFHSLSMLQFKNYSDRSFSFAERIIGICGNNGVGKTNLLDALHYLCMTKSYFSRVDANNVQQGKNGFRLEARVQLNDRPEHVVCILRETGKKEFSINHEVYDKLSRHIGRYPCVVIAPDDSILITGGSEERRKFFDSLLSQLDSQYLQHLITYTKLIQQRNSLLRSFAETNNRDLSLLDVLDEQLVKPGEYIFDRRKEFLVSFLPQVKHMYNEIAMQPEDITLLYESQLLPSSFPALLAAARSRDFAACRSTAGTHRDEIEITLGSQFFRNIASQGQRKSLLFALKLVELEVLKKDKGFPPLLLLDDVFEKLDESRISNLLQKVCVENEGQVFITDTSKERLRLQLESLGVGFEMVGL
ncbi:MAG: DNA replication/repair protein RecF [Chitinophagaceae bacterium]|nr:DNA replication/repair protein RecF [Chitinophagaceae bacterium]